MILPCPYRPYPLTLFQRQKEANVRLSFAARTLESLKPEPKLYTAWDSGLSGFGLRVSPKGTKTFIVMKGKERKVTTLGRFPHLALKDARTRAMQELTRTTQTPITRPTEAIRAFGEALKGRVKPDTLNQYLSYLNQMDFTSLTMTFPEVQEKLRKWEGKPFAQNYAYASLRNFLNWCLEHGYIEKSPLFRKQPPNKTKSRDRVLTDTELGRIWRCTGDDTYGRILRLLILTGQRRIEVRNLKPEDVADGLITFRTKGDRTNVLPVTPLVEENLVLPFTFNNWTNAKDRFDRDCGVDFRHHDLRRTLATKLAQMGTSFVVIERILGHAIPGVAGVYNRHTYLLEVKEALLAYENHIRKLSTTAA